MVEIHDMTDVKRRLQLMGPPIGVGSYHYHHDTAGLQKRDRPARQRRTQDMRPVPPSSIHRRQVARKSFTSFFDAELMRSTAKPIIRGRWPKNG